jgi:hypothetical protein
MIGEFESVCITQYGVAFTFSLGYLRKVNSPAEIRMRLVLRAPTLSSWVLNKRYEWLNKENTNAGEYESGAVCKGAGDDCRVD